MNSELEYNLAGGLLLTVRENDFRQLQEGLTNSGYRYGCVLPFRALAKEKGIENLRSSPLQIIHMEEAWNPTNEDNLTKAVFAGILGHYKRFRGDKSEPPILQDSLFPSKVTCERLFKELFKAFPNIKFISHKIDADFPSDKLLLEVNPGIGLSQSEILAQTEEKGIGLVFDPRHLLPTEKVISTPGQPTKTPKGEWEKQFHAFQKRIEVVDINPPTKEDVQELLHGRGLLKELALAAKQVEIRFLRVEIPIPPAQQLPGSPLQHKGFELLRDIGQALKES